MARMSSSSWRSCSSSHGEPLTVVCLKGTPVACVYICCSFRFWFRRTDTFSSRFFAHCTTSSCAFSHPLAFRRMSAVSFRAFLYTAFFSCPLTLIPSCRRTSTSTCGYRRAFASSLISVNSWDLRPLSSDFSRASLTAWSCCLYLKE